MAEQMSEANTKIIHWKGYSALSPYGSVPGGGATLENDPFVQYWKNSEEILRVPTLDELENTAEYQEIHFENTVDYGYGEYLGTGLFVLYEKITPEHDFWPDYEGDTNLQIKSTWYVATDDDDDDAIYAYPLKKKT